MPRRLRSSFGGEIFHVCNRGTGRRQLFFEKADYDAFERVLVEAHARYPIRITNYCVMPNHWHFVLWPEDAHHMSEFMRWLTVTHAQRWHRHHGTSGTGPVYQGRFKSFPVQCDSHFLVVARYVERNPVRANLVERAEDWPWSSLRRRQQSIPLPGLLAPWPVPIPEDWLEWVNTPQTAAELEALRTSVTRGRPFGGSAWVRETALRLDLQSTLRARGRPRRDSGEKKTPDPFSE